MKRAQRKLLVFSALLGVLSVTSALLLALAPAPVAPDAATSLFAVDAPASLNVIFDTKTPVAPRRWKYIFIHHSQTATGNAVTLAQSSAGVGDHFVIGNGDGAVDGEIQLTQRWNQQQNALPPTGAAFSPSHTSACISICLVGDFDQTVPTPTQLRRVGQLVGALRDQLQIDARDVLLIDQPRSAAGIGKYFPKGAFRQQLIP
jgi:hypothetical protein